MKKIKLTMSKRKELKLIREKKEQILREMNSVAADSGSYERLSKSYKNLTKVEEAILTGRKDRSWVPTALNLGLGILGIGASLAGTIYLGELSYEREKDLTLCNGRVWNLATRLKEEIHKKDNNIV